MTSDPQGFSLSLGGRVRVARNRLRWSQTELASRLGVRQGTVSQWERGRNLPDASNVVALCDVLGVSPAWVLGLDAVDLEDVEDSKTAEVVAMRARLNRVRRQLEDVVRSLGDVQPPVAREAILLFRAEALRQDRLLAARYGPLAWLAVADSIASEWIRTGEATEDELALWLTWRDVAAGGDDLPDVTWRDAGLAADDVSDMIGGE